MGDHYTPIPERNKYLKVAPEFRGMMDSRGVGSRMKDPEKNLPPKYWVTGISTEWQLEDLIAHGILIQDFGRELIERLFEAEHPRLTSELSSTLYRQREIIKVVERFRARDIQVPSWMRKLTPERIEALKRDYVRYVQISLSHWKMVVEKTEDQPVIDEEGRIPFWVTAHRTLMWNTLGFLEDWASLLVYEQSHFGKALSDEDRLMRDMEEVILEGKVVGDAANRS